MKPLLVSLCLAVQLNAADSPAVTNLWLDSQTVLELPVGVQRVTTIVFPKPIQAIDGAGLTADARTPGLFQVAQSPGNSSLAIRALAPGVTGNLNVRLEDQTYAFLLVENKRPMLVVNLLSGTAAGGPPAPVAPGHPPGGAPAMSSLQLMGLLDRARNYPALRKHHPALVQDVTLDRPESTMDYATFTVRLQEVLRFDRSDALAFRVALQSKTGHEVRYAAGSWAVRVGDRLYTQAIADGSGLIPAQGEVVAWFLIQGSADGQRNLLSPRNRFLVLVNPL